MPAGGPASCGAGAGDAGGQGVPPPASGIKFAGHRSREHGQCRVPGPPRPPWAVVCVLERGASPVTPSPHGPQFPPGSHSALDPLGSDRRTTTRVHHVASHTAVRRPQSPPSLRPGLPRTRVTTDLGLRRCPAVGGSQGAPGGLATSTPECSSVATHGPRTSRSVTGLAGSAVTCRGTPWPLPVWVPHERAARNACFQASVPVTPGCPCCGGSGSFCPSEQSSAMMLVSPVPPGVRVAVCPAPSVLRRSDRGHRLSAPPAFLFLQRARVKTWSCLHTRRPRGSCLLCFLLQG